MAQTSDRSLVYAWEGGAGITQAIAASESDARAACTEEESRTSRKSSRSCVFRSSAELSLFASTKPCARAKVVGAGERGVFWCTKWGGERDESCGRRRSPWPALMSRARG